MIYSKVYPYIGLERILTGQDIAQKDIIEMV